MSLLAPLLEVSDTLFGHGTADTQVIHKVGTAASRGETRLKSRFRVAKMQPGGLSLHETFPCIFVGELMLYFFYDRSHLALCLPQLVSGEINHLGRVRPEWKQRKCEHAKQAGAFAKRPIAVLDARHLQLRRPSSENAAAFRFWAFCAVFWQATALGQSRKKRNP